MAEFDYDKLMQRIGEFVVTFQWMENRFREIGWLIDDPERNAWPPTTLRNLKNYDLLNTVNTKYTDLINSFNRDDNDARKSEFDDIVSRCHTIRQYRNNLLHSAFIELNAGDEVVGLVRSNPKLSTDPNTGDPVYDQEFLTDAVIETEMKKMAELCQRLNLVYTQLIHWIPFSQFQSA